MARDDTAREDDSILDQRESRTSTDTTKDASNVFYQGRDFTVRTIGSEGTHLTIVEGTDVSK